MYMLLKKGADREQVRFLDKGLRNFSRIIEQEKGINISKVSGAGAAGGGSSMSCIFSRPVKIGNRNGTRNNRF